MWRKAGTCESHDDCPSYFQCFDVTEDLLVEAVPTSTSGYCTCYSAVGKTGDDCKDNIPVYSIVFAIICINVIFSWKSFVDTLMILIKLKKADALDLKKPGIVCMSFAAPGLFFLGSYQFSLFMGYLNLDESSIFLGSIRLISTLFLVTFFQLAAMQIGKTWIVIGATAGKKGLQRKDYPTNLKLQVYGASGFQYLTILVVLFTAVSKNTQIFRLYTVFCCLVLVLFYHFGGRSLAKLLMPATRDPTVSDEKWAQTCEPANAILGKSKICCYCALSYIILSIAASPFLSKAGKGSLPGILLFECGVGILIFCLRYGCVAYCVFGVKKVLAGGGKSGRGASTVAPSSASSTDSDKN
jgi:hypothetical protein